MLAFLVLVLLVLGVFDFGLQSNFFHCVTQYMIPRCSSDSVGCFSFFVYSAGRPFSLYNCGRLLNCSGFLLLLLSLSDNARRRIIGVRRERKREKESTHTGEVVVHMLGNLFLLFCVWDGETWLFSAGGFFWVGGGGLRLAILRCRISRLW